MEGGLCISRGKISKVKGGGDGKKGVPPEGGAGGLGEMRGVKRLGR